ncbi:10 TM domain-containing transmembrane protein [Acrasis kona]|uniref:10 TM domain-containing transmembrane protein n=1 Tax=Acrasis kona TaxID=1008807 RepID=A0AAW2ZM48_9EUKA
MKPRSSLVYLVLIIALTLCNFSLEDVTTQSAAASNNANDELMAIEDLILSTRQRYLTMISDECQVLFFKAEISMHQLELLHKSNIITADQSNQYAKLLTDQLQSDKGCDSEIITKLFKRSVIHDNHLLALKLLVKQMSLARIATASHLAIGTTGANPLPPIEAITTNTLLEPIQVSQQAAIASDPQSIPSSQPTTSVGGLPPTDLVQPSLDPSSSSSSILGSTEVINIAKPIETTLDNTLTYRGVNNFVGCMWFVSIMVIISSMFYLVGSPEYTQLTKLFPKQAAMALNFGIYILCCLFGKVMNQDVGVYFALLGCIGIAQAKVFQLTHSQPPPSPKQKKKEKESDDESQDERDEKKKKKITFVVWNQDFGPAVEIAERMAFHEEFLTTCMTAWLLMTVWYGSRMLGCMTIVGCILTVACNVKKFKKELLPMECIVLSCAAVCGNFIVLSSIAWVTKINRFIHFFQLFEFGVAYIAWLGMIYGIMYMSMLGKRDGSVRFVMNVVCMVAVTTGQLMGSYIPSISHVKNVCGVSSFLLIWIRFVQFGVQSKMLPKPVISLGLGIMMFVSGFVWNAFPQFFFNFTM